MPETKKSHPASKLLLGLILICFFFSGMTGLIYEILWSRMIVPIVGSAPFAVSIILTVFMGGLGLGSYLAGRVVDRIKNPVRLVSIYAWLEIFIGLYALAVPFLVQGFKPLYAILYNRFFEHFLLFNFLTFLGCSVVLCLPVIAMGATLPILCRFYVSRIDSLGTRAGRLYGLNTIGAALGSMLCGFWLLSALGIGGTLALAVSMNLLIGAVCWAAAALWGKALRVQQDPESEKAAVLEKSNSVSAEGFGVRTAVVGALLIFAVSGFCAMAYEVIWTNLLGLLVGPTTYSFTIILATFISSLALGSLFFGWLGDKTKRPVTILVFTQVSAALLALVSSQVLGNSQLFFSKVIYELSGNFLLLHSIKMILLFAFMLPTCLCLGATFPLVGKIYTKNINRIGRSIGFAYLINTIGAVLGSFCAGFLLLPFLGKVASIRWVVGLQLVTAVIVSTVLLLKRPRQLGRGQGIMVCLAAIAGLLLCSYWPRWSEYSLAKGKYHRFYEAGVEYKKLGWAQALLEGGGILEKMEEGKLVYSGDGIGGFTCVMEYPNAMGPSHYSLLLSGKSDASSRADMRTQTLLAHLPMLFHPQAKNVMVLGLASGVTAGEVLNYPVENLDVLEINQRVIEASDFFLPWNNDVLQDSRTNLIVQDARAHLQLTQQRYDVIISEPSNPWMAGLAALFTCDFFELALDRLTDDGMFVQFFHSYEMDWSTFSLIGRSFASVFPNSVLIVTEPAGYGYDYLLVGFKGSEGLELENAQRNLPSAQRSTNIDLPDARLFYRMLIAENLSDLFGDGPLNTDWSPILEFAAPKKMYGQHSNQQYGSDPSIWDNLKTRSVLSPQASQTIKELANTIDLQIDYAQYALSVHSPFPNMVDLGQATEAQKERLTAIFEEYCQQNVPELDMIEDPQLVRRCREVIIDSISTNIDTMPYPSLSYSALAEQYLILQQFENASQAYQKALSYTDNPSLLNNYAICLTQLGKLEEAVKTLETAVAKNPDSSLLCRTLGNLYNRTGRSDQAILYYQKSLNLNPLYTEAAAELAGIYTERRRFQEAIELYRLILTAFPNNAGTYNDMAIVYIQMEQKQQAVECLAQALARQPNQYQSLGNLRHLVFNLLPDEAIRLSKIACEITENRHPGVLATLAIAYAGAQRYQEALATAEIALPLAQQYGPAELVQEIQNIITRIKTLSP